MYYVDNGQIEILSDGSRKDLGPSARKDVSTPGNYHIRQFMKDSSNRIGLYTFCLFWIAILCLRIGKFQGSYI